MTILSTLVMEVKQEVMCLPFFLLYRLRIKKFNKVNLNLSKSTGKIIKGVNKGDK